MAKECIANQQLLKMAARVGGPANLYKILIGGGVVLGIGIGIGIIN